MKYPGSSPGFIHLRDHGKTDVIIALPDAIRIKAGSLLRKEVKEILGYGAVETVCTPAGRSYQANNNHKRKNGKAYA
jgi:hypothetical protein